MEIPAYFSVTVLSVLLCTAITAAVWFRALLKAARRKLAQQHAILDRIESLAQIGHWHYDPGSGEQYWSAQMCRLYGLDPSGTPQEDLHRSLYKDEGKFVWNTLRDHTETRESFRIEYDISPPAGGERLMRMDALNTFDSHGSLRYTDAVVSDVTDEYQRARKLAEEKSAALEQAATARELAMTDPLTGLANRRRIMAEIDRRIMQCRKNGRKLSIIVFDLDHLKQVNDTFGHQAGDKVLRRVAAIALEQVRDSDLVGRIGGDEFIWLLPDACQEIASNAAVRLSRAIAESGSLEGLPQITVSAGYACWTPADTGLTLFAGADAALYRAKQAGRNKVRMAA